MNRDEFKSLPPSFFDEERRTPAPNWLWALGGLIVVCCVIAAVWIARSRY